MTDDERIRESEIGRVKQKAESVHVPEPKKSGSNIDLLSLLNEDQKRNFGKNEHLALVRYRREHGNKTQIVEFYEKVEFKKQRVQQ
jgi:hypothetical protein